MSLAEGVAGWLGGNVPGLTWQSDGSAYPDGTVGIYAEQLPSGPDVAVAVLTSSGQPSDSLLGWDMPALEVRVRGDRDPRTSQGIAQQIYSALHGLADVELPDGTWLGLAVCLDSGPTTSAPDEQGRWQWVVGVDLQVLAPSEHRPA
ncbi:minor capsid protein [Frankia sp. AgB32]|uniref:minor capsid protein n=1 Tax=Frankia sp. AgB32 TaxID=631119 RepID=UPI00200C014F|nr:minor capsid protein [Frankia sp. AgB32]MCK9896974.1 minor capsid protein [Frankia sp. AgB32]